MKEKRRRLYEVEVRSRYNPLDVRTVRVWATSKTDARERLWDVLGTDEWRYVRATEVR